MTLLRMWVIALLVLTCLPVGAANPADWPEPTPSALPWTRWWWHGSAVDEQNITRCLEEYAAAGLGGVEITCIYGVKGTKDLQLPYLSPEWVEAVTHAAAEAKRLEMGVDLPPGSGWRMGGPNVALEDSNAELVITEPTDEQGHWAIEGRPLREKVKRPAPGGGGYTINPYSRNSVGPYLADWSRQTAKLPDDAIRASFHDSFEYEGNWSDRFLATFGQSRGYRLQDQLPALAGQGDADTVARVKSDFRETLSDLVLSDLIVPWVEWAHSHGQLARNQSHGSPANWLDLYAACDIPETESFGPLEKNDANPLIQKFASSAAHVAGRRLVASESATWLGEHFNVTLAMLKERLDRQMLAGVNHVIYHGTAYSPAVAEWPGWLFYASTQLNPQNPIWRDLPALNRYVTRCQSWLQAGEPANDLLIYWPIYDVWHDEQGLRKNLRVHNSHQWFLNQPIGKAANELDVRGVSFDYISDAQVLTCQVEEARIVTPGASYEAILIPDARFMPPATLAKLSDLGNRGAKVLFLQRLPESAPGLLTEEKRTAFAEAVSAAQQAAYVGEALDDLLAEAGIAPEPLSVGTPLRSIRRKLDDGWCYLVKNMAQADFDGPIQVRERWQSVALMDPLTGAIGTPTREGQKFRLQLPAGGTVFIRTYDGDLDAEPWQYCDPQGASHTVEGEWQVEFLTGGPEPPATLTTRDLTSWTRLAGEAGEKFAGTAAYTINLTPPAGHGVYLLSLGEVADSARVFLNGKELGVLFVPPFKMPVVLSAGESELKVEVTNVAANRIRDLDRRGVEWRIFDDINFVNINYKPFDASDWPIRDAGLLGPVTLEPLTNEMREQ